MGGRAGALVACVAALASTTGHAAADDRRGSCMALSEDGRVVFVADTEGEAVARVAIAQPPQVVRVPVTGGPEQVLLLPGGRVAITRRFSGRVAILDAATLETKREAVVGTEPYGLALAPSGRELYVTDVQDRRLTALDPRDLSRRWSVALRDDDARAIAVAPDGRRAYVAHLRAPRISVVDLERRAPLQSIPLPARHAFERATRVVSIDVTPDGRSLWTAYNMVAPNGAAQGCSSYGCQASDAVTPIMSAVARIDLARHRPSAQVVHSGSVFDPSDVVWSARDAEAWISGSSVKTGSGRSLDTAYTECSLVRGDLVVRRDPLGDRVLVGAFGLAPREIPLGRPDAPELAAGRRLFHEPLGCRIAGAACQTCHAEGRHDGVVWSSPAGRVQTPLLSGRLDLTQPYLWHASALTLEDSIAQTLQRLGGGSGSSRVLTRDERHTLAQFLREGLPPIPRKLGTPLALRGAELFATLDCARCHDPRRAYQNGGRYPLSLHDVIDVPSLRYVRLGAPYLHDGSAADLAAVLRGGTMGRRAAELSRTDQAALIAFLETL